MTKLEQRLIELTKDLASARSLNDQNEIDRLEDEIEEIEFQLEEEYENEYSSKNWD